MRKLITLVIVLAAGLALGAATADAQERKHAAKPVWQAMVAGLNDIQSITGALVVFDMARAATIADGLVAREEFITTLDLPKVVTDGHANVAKEAKKLAAAIRTGDEKKVSAGIGDVLAACSGCHYWVRDAERRKEMGIELRARLSRPPGNRRRQAPF